jgi:hypothetical protein
MPWWVLLMVGCCALVLCPQLPWTTSPSLDGTIATNGFNSSSFVSGSSGLLAQLESLGTSQQDLASQADSLFGDSSGVIVIPSLSSIPDNLGGSDSSAKWGIFVLVLGAIALFTALWLLWGENARRRSMVRIVALCSALALVPLVHELFRTGLTLSSSSGDSTGAGIYVGIVGTIIAVCAGVRLFFAWRQSETQYWTLQPDRP